MTKSSIQDQAELGSSIGLEMATKTGESVKEALSKLVILQYIGLHLGLCL